MASYSLQEWYQDLFEGIDGTEFSLPYFPTYYAPGHLIADTWYQNSSHTMALDGNGGAWCADEQTLAVAPFAISWSPTVPTANQYVSCRIRALTIPVGGPSLAGITLRFVLSAMAGHPDSYSLMYDSSVPGWKLLKQHNNVVTVLATYSAAGQEVPAGECGSAILVANGTTLTAITNGVEHAPVTDAVITAAGAIGMFQSAHGGSDDVSGIHLEGFLAAYLPA